MTENQKAEKSVGARRGRPPKADAAIPDKPKPSRRNSTWVTKTIAETDSDGTTHYITKLADAYKVSGDSFYMQDGKAVLPLGTLTVGISYGG